MPLPFLLRRSRKAERAFPPEPLEALIYGSLLRNPHSPSPVLWGYGRFRITLPEMEAVP